MNLNDYLIDNDRKIGDLVNLFSVGSVLDKVSGDTFPMLPGGAIGFDESMNLMDMDISDDSFNWYNSLANSDKEVVDEVMDELAYESFSKEELELYNSVPPCSSMTPVKENPYFSTEVDLGRDVPNEVWESEDVPNGWDVDVDENGPFIVADDKSWKSTWDNYVDGDR